MKLLIILFAVASITNVSDGQNKGKKRWYDFWKKPASRTNQILKYFYCRSRNFTESTIKHTDSCWKGVQRLWFVFWFGACPERIKTTTTTTSTTTTTTTTPWPHGRSRKYPLVYHKDEQDFVPKPTVAKVRTVPTTRCPPRFLRPPLQLN